MWPNPVEPAIDYVISLDLAQGGPDYTALSVLERTEPANGDPAHYRVTWLERWRDRRTARIPQRIAEVERQLAAVHREREVARSGSRDGINASPLWRLAVDITGVGPFALDPLRQAGFDPIGVLIHGGAAVSRGDGNVYRTPKRDVAGAIAVCLEQGRLTIVESLPDAVVLRSEMENFRVKVHLETGHDSYAAGTDEPWRSGAHDDAVLSVGIGVWVGEYQRVPRLDPVIVAAFHGLPR